MEPIGNTNPCQHAQPAANVAGGSMSELGILFHGSYDEWRSRTIDSFHRARVRMDSVPVEVLSRLISKAVLDRVPDKYKQDTLSLWEALPKYSKAFPIMELPTELVGHILKFMDLTKTVKIISDGKPRIKTSGSGFSAVAHSSQIFREAALSQIWKQFEFACSVRHLSDLRHFVTRPEVMDHVKHISKFTIIVRNGAGTFVRLLLEPKKPLCYFAKHMMLSPNLNDTTNEGFSALCPDNHLASFDDEVQRAIHRLGLDTSEEGNRGERLIEFIFEFETLYTKWLFVF